MLSGQINISIAAGINKILRFLCIFFLMSSVHPEIFSQWVIIALILQYSIFLQAGSPFALHREASIALGEEDDKKIQAIISSSLRNYFFSLFALFFLLIFFNYDYLLFYTFLYITLINIGNLLLLQARALFEDRKAMLALYADSLIIIILTLVLVNEYSIKGLLISFSAGSLAYIVFCRPNRETMLRSILLSKAELKESFRLIKYGIPLLVYNLLLTLKDTWDILFVSNFYIDSLALYSPTQIFGNGVRVFAGLIGIILLPNMAREFGRSERVISRANYELASKAIFFFLISFIIFSALFYPFSFFLIEEFIPQYSESKDLIYFRTVTIFLGLVPLPVLMLLNSARKTKLSLIIAFSTLFFSIILFYLLNLRLELISSLIYSLFIGNITFLFLSYLIIKREIMSTEKTLNY